MGLRCRRLPINTFVPAPMEVNDVDSLVKKLNEYIKTLQDKIEENNRKIVRYKKESDEFDEERALFENWLSSQMLQ